MQKTDKYYQILISKAAIPSIKILTRVYISSGQYPSQKFCDMVQVKIGVGNLTAQGRYSNESGFTPLTTL